MLDFTCLLATLAQSRPLFHSEADFQHAFAWEIHTQYPSAKIRLEYRPANLLTKMYIDIWVVFPNGEVAAIELKYKTRSLTVDNAGETFELRNQSAQDQGRYDFLRDIARLENITATFPAIRGAAIFLSNDSTYWKSPDTPDTVDAAFRIHEGCGLKGELAWSTKASAGTKESREEPINLSGLYHASWSNYASMGQGRWGEFRFLLVNVVAGTVTPSNCAANARVTGVLGAD